jgi:hypothetical protein
MKKYVDETAIENLQAQLDALKKSIVSINTCYPIGSIYISVSSENPASIFGFGTWERIQDKFLLASGPTYALNSTGGEAKHTLTVNELPSHTHTSHGIGIATTAYEKNLALRSVELNEYHEGDTIMRVENTGGGAAHNNMPPYLVVNIWKRIS